MFAAVWISDRSKMIYQVEEDYITGFAIDLFTSVIYDSILRNNTIQLGGNGRKAAPFHNVLRQFLLGSIVVKFRETDNLLPIRLILVRQIKIEQLRELLSDLQKPQVTSAERFANPEAVNNICVTISS